MCRGHSAGAQPYHRTDYVGSDAVSVSLAMGGRRGVQMLTAGGVVCSSNSQDSGPNVSDPLTDRVGTFGGRHGNLTLCSSLAGCLPLCNQGNPPWLHLCPSQ